MSSTSASESQAASAAQQSRIDALTQLGAVKRKRKHVEMVTRGENLLSRSSEFAEAGDSSMMANLSKLGLRAMNPEEVESNVISQVQEQMEQHSSQSSQYPFKLLDELVPLDRLKFINPTRGHLEGMSRIAHDTVLRQPVSSSGPLSRGRKAQYQIKEQIIRASLAHLYPDSVAKPQTTSIDNTSLENSSAIGMLQGSITSGVENAKTKTVQPRIAGVLERAKNQDKQKKTMRKLKIIGPKPPKDYTPPSATLNKSDSKMKKKLKSSKLKPSPSKSSSSKKQVHRKNTSRISDPSEENGSTITCPVCNTKKFPSSQAGQMNLSLHVDRCIRRNKQSLEDANTDQSAEVESDSSSMSSVLRPTRRKSNSSASQKQSQVSDDEDEAPKFMYDDDWDDKVYANRVLLYFSMEKKWRECRQAHLQAGCTPDEADQRTQDDAVEAIADWKEEAMLELEVDSDPLTQLVSLLRNPNSRMLDDYLRKRYENDVEMVTIAGGHLLPRRTFIELFGYQREGVDWFLGLQAQGCGGILGDEMGLGKTVQVAAALAALKCSGKLGRRKPALVLSPATTLSQWVQEIHKWHPCIRVLLMHSSGAALTSGKWTRKRLVANVWKGGDVLVTTYQGLRLAAELCLPVRWTHVVLDEGHKIRNPDADVTLVCKQLQTVNRVILSGAPIQNNLRELWSLFDFVYPGRLGTLPMFENQFSIPINAGGFSNASPMQVQMAYKCALVLKETISPYLLRRLKKDVVVENLPKKVEQVLFCNITDEQRLKYEQYLSRPEIQDIILDRANRKLMTFRAIKNLQKICNHPDLILHDKPDDFGAISRSGKMLVLKTILELWRKQGHRVLLFSQGVLMLNILEEFVQAQGYPYYRMDGTTPIHKRQPLIDQFNDMSNDVFVFCLTTKVGGLGVNLIGANRVLIFDPDWNPSTDLQARERAWRLGQKRPVTIYRLITSGTIEEKIYHRQIFKQFLTNKILHDPRQKRFFKLNDLRDLFSLGRDTSKDSTATETGSLFVHGTVDLPQPTGSGPDVEGGEELPVNNVQGLQRVEASRTQDGEEQEEEENKGKSHEEENSAILQQIFDQQGFRHAFDHDHVERASKNNPERQFIEAEASRVAMRAKAALKRDQDMCAQAHESGIQKPTWTGMRGSVGGPGGASGGVLGSLSSGALLSKMRERSWMREPKSKSVLEEPRSGLAASLAVGQSRGMVSERFAKDVSQESPEDVKFNKVVRSLRTFLQRRRGQRASTREILKAFRSKMAESEAHVFREILRELAECEQGVWCLKPMYV